MSYMFSSKRVVKVTSVCLVSSLLPDNDISAKGCSANERNSNVPPRITINQIDNGGKDDKNEWGNGHRIITRRTNDFIGNKVMSLYNEKNVDNDINEKLADLPISSDLDDKDNLNSEEVNTKDDLNIEEKADDVFADLRALIDDLKRGKGDFTEALKLIHEEECKLSDKVNKDELYEINKGLFSFFLNSIIESINLLFGVDVDDNIYKPLLLSSYNMNISSLKDINVANSEFLRINSYIIILHKFVEDNKPNNELSIKLMAKQLHSVLKDVKNVQSTLTYAVYSGIASVLMNFVVHLQDKLIFLFPSLYNSSDKPEITIRLNVKDGDFIKNIGSSLDDHKLIKQMLSSDCALLKLLYCHTVNISSPIFSVSKSNFIVKANGLNYLSLLSGCNDCKCDLVNFLNKYIFSMKVNNFESTTYKESAENLNNLISISGDHVIDNVVLENKTSKKNYRLDSIKFI